jgi:hypothetical protein
VHDIIGDTAVGVDGVGDVFAEETERDEAVLAVRLFEGEVEVVGLVR